MACSGIGPKLASMALTLSSPSFAPGQPIPRNHTGDGDDLSPPLAWADVPHGTRSLALVVEDPDAPDPRAPQRTFTHWVVYNIQPSVTGLPLAADQGALPAGTRQGKNDFGTTNWGGPKPPIGRHRYFFKLYALDTTLDLPHADRNEMLRAIRGHVLAEAELMGTYEHTVG